MSRIIKLVCIFVMALSCFQIYRITSAQKQAETSFQELRETYQAEDTGTAPDLGLQSDSGTEVSDDPQEALPSDPPVPEVNPRITELLERNGDFVGWLTVEGTRIDYPVVCSPQEPEYYLRHGFDGAVNSHGVPFMDAACDLQESENLIIYGHNMRDGSMFYDLAMFTNTDFCEQNPLITFDTVSGPTTWQVVTVFKIAERDTRRFPYHMVTEFSPETQTAEDYISRCGYYSIWTADIPIEDDARLLTLSTCEYTLRNGRLVVVAKQIG